MPSYQHHRVSFLLDWINAWSGKTLASLILSAFTITSFSVWVCLSLSPRVLSLGVLYHQIVLPPHSITFGNFLGCFSGVSLLFLKNAHHFWHAD